MRQPPALSIGMPVYNADRYLREAIDSLLAQTLQDFELIISDNASTDGTRLLCQDYAAKDTRVRYIRQPRNIGAIANFDFVLRQASGSYFSWAAGDDVWDRKWFECLLAHGAKHGCSSVFGHVQQIDEFSRSIRHPSNGKSFNFDQGVLVRRLRYFLQFEGLGKANLFYTLFRRESIIRLPIATYSHDYHAIYDYLRMEPICSVPGVFLGKRIHDDGEGNKPRAPGSPLKTFARLAFPIDASGLTGYFRHASPVERLLLALLLPLKYAIAYVHIVRRLLAKTNSDVLPPSAGRRS